MKHIADAAIIREPNSEINTWVAMEVNENLKESRPLEPGEEVLEVAKIEVEEEQSVTMVWDILLAIHQLEKNVGVALLVNNIFESGFRAGQEYPKS